MTDPVTPAPELTPSPTAVAPAAAAAITPAEAPTPNPAEPPAAEAAPSGTEPPAPPAPPAADWKDKRLATLTAKSRAKDEALAAKDAEIAALRAGKAVPSEQEIAAKAQQIVAEADFNRACNDVVAKGRTAFGETEFNERLGALRQVVDDTDPMSVAKYSQLVQVAIDTGSADKILFELGGDLNEANRLLSLPPTRMAVELTRRATAPATGATVSATPKPIKPVGARSASHTEVLPDDPERADNLTTAQWIARREAQVTEKAKQKAGAA